MQKHQYVAIDNSENRAVSLESSPKPSGSNKTVVKSGERPQFPPRKRSIPTGFDFDLDEVWWNRLKNRPGDPTNVNIKDPLNRIVPSQYYSRHLLPKNNANNVQDGQVAGPSSSRSKQAEAWVDANSRSKPIRNEDRGNKRSPDIGRDATSSSLTNDSFDF